MIKIILFLIFFISITNAIPLNINNLFDTTDIDISLEELLNIEVTTASKKAQSISKIPSSVVIISRTDIKRYGYRSLEEIFQNIPGLYLIDYKGYMGSSIGVRGYATQLNTNIVVLLNGNRIKSDVYNAFSFNMLNIPVESIDRIEIVRGPLSIMYGSNAFFGAINIITNNIAFSPITNNSVNAFYETPKSFKFSFNRQDNSNNFDYTLTTGYKYNYGIDEKFSKMINNFTSISSNFGISDPNKTSKNYFNTKSFFLNFTGTHDNLNVNITFDKSYFGQTFSTLFYHPAENKLTYFNGSISYDKDLSNHIRINSKISYNSFLLYMADNYYSADSNTIYPKNDIYSYGEYFSDKITFTTDIFYNNLKNLEIQFGTKYEVTFDAGDKTDAPFNSTNYNLINRAGSLDNSNYKTLSLYSEFNYKLNPSIILVGGIRAEKIFPFDLILHRGAYTPGYKKYEKRYYENKIYLVSRGAIIYNISEYNTIKLLYGEAIRVPSLWEYRNNIISGKDLSPEKIRTEEINFLNLIAKNFALNFSIYANQLDKLINRTVILTPPYTSYYSNTNAINAYGAEILLNYDFSTIIKSELAINYQKSEYRAKAFENVKVEFSPEFLGYFKISYLVNDLISVNLSNIYVGSMYSQWDNNLKDPSDPTKGKIGRIGPKVEPYILSKLNILASNIPLNKNNYISLSFAIDNLFDKEFRYPINSVSAWANKGILGNRRSYTFNAIYNF
jgi:outer membrane receptor for ferrienterochelin and colicin